MLISLDVGFANLGWAIIDKKKIIKCGVIETEKSKKKTTRVADDYAYRSAFIARNLAEIIVNSKVSAVIGELPSGGALNASAAVMMNMATAISSSVAELLEKPSEWVTPTDVKKAVTGLRTASKETIMKAVVDKFGGERITKWVKCKVTPKNPSGKRAQYTYFINGERFSGGKFEHIADAIGAYMASAQGNLVKMYG